MTDYEKLIAAHNGDMALYYIWLKANSGSADKKQAAKDLCMTLSQISSAEELLKLSGIDIPACSREPVPGTAPAPSDEPHSYTPEEIDKARSDKAFDSILNEYVRVTGKFASTEDLSRLLNIYHNLGLAADTIFVLLHYCQSEAEPRTPTIRFIEKAAYSWANREIQTAEQAEAYVEHIRSLKSRENEIKSILGISNRLTANLTAYIDRWIEAGYSDSMIEDAYEKTLKNTGRLAWDYLDKVLSNAKEKEDAGRAAGSTPLPDTIRKSR